MRTEPYVDRLILPVSLNIACQNNPAYMPHCSRKSIELL